MTSSEATRPIYVYMLLVSFPCIQYGIVS